MVKKISEEKDTEVVEEKVKKTKEVSPEAIAEKKPAVKKAAAPKAEKVEAVKEEKIVAPKKPKVKKVVEDNRKYATGKRKDSVARVWISVGKGEFSINGRTLEHYFKRPILRMMVNQPFSIVNAESKFDVFSTVEGGGLSGQAGALRHGISKALVEFDGEYRGGLKSQGFLTRDSRVVERKKYGRKKARKRFQFSKR